MRQEHLNQNLHRSHFTDDLFRQYRKHLGPVRYRILLEAQVLVAPQKVREYLDFRKTSLLHPLIALYKVTRRIRLDGLLKDLILPKKYEKEIKGLDNAQTKSCPYKGRS